MRPARQRVSSTRTATQRTRLVEDPTTFELPARRSRLRADLRTIARAQKWKKWKR